MTKTDMNRVWCADNPNPRPNLAEKMAAMWQGTSPKTTYIGPNSVWHRIESMMREELEQERKKILSLPII